MKRHSPDCLCAECYRRPARSADLHPFAPGSIEGASRPTSTSRRLGQAAVAATASFLVGLALGYARGKGWL